MERAERSAGFFCDGDREELHPTQRQRTVTMMNELRWGYRRVIYANNKGEESSPPRKSNTISYFLVVVGGFLSFFMSLSMSLSFLPCLAITSAEILS